MRISEDILLEEIWKFLPISVLDKYCQSNKMMYSILESNENWKWLIWRDFQIKFSGNDAKEEFKRFYNFDQTLYYNYNLGWTSFNSTVELKLDKPLGQYSETELYAIYVNLGGEKFYRPRRSEQMMKIIEYFANKFKRPNVNFGSGFGKSLAFYLSE